MTGVEGAGDGMACWHSLPSWPPTTGGGGAPPLVPYAWFGTLPTSGGAYTSASWRVKVLPPCGAGWRWLPLSVHLLPPCAVWCARQHLRQRLPNPCMQDKEPGCRKCLVALRKKNPGEGSAENLWVGWGEGG